MEALRQDVAEEAADKLACCERHDFVARSAVGTIIFVVERDTVLVERNQSAIRDGNTVGVARQIGKHRLRSAEMGILVEELQLAGLMRGDELGKHQPAE